MAATDPKAEISPIHSPMPRLLDRLHEKFGVSRRLGDSSGRMTWPRRGVYFFFEEGERRLESGTGPRVVRVGTHALKPNSNTRRWDRLRQHRGGLPGVAIIADRSFG